jgi:hypothetical protein
MPRRRLPSRTPAEIEARVRMSAAEKGTERTPRGPANSQKPGMDLRARCNVLPVQRRRSQCFFPPASHVRCLLTCGHCCGPCCAYLGQKYVALLHTVRVSMHGVNGIVDFRHCCLLSYFYPSFLRYACALPTYTACTYMTGMRGTRARTTRGSA